MITTTITGLGKLQKTISELQAALTEMHGTIAELKFNPSDPASVAAAIAEMERAVDARVAAYRGNSVVESIAEKAKQAFRKAIENKAATAQP